MKIAAAYIRVSTEEQTELSPDSQIKQIRDYAKKNGYIVPDEYIFHDDGISGRTTAKRPGFNKMIGTAKLKPKPFDAILLWKFSRFARNREDSIVYKSMLRKLGIEVISISETIGDDKMSVLIEAMIEAMDEYYSINLAEEVKRGMLEKFSRGQIVSAPPIGYTLEDGNYIPDDNAELIKQIYNMFLSNASYRQIAKELNSEGYRTIKGNTFESRNIEYIIRNPVYAGKLRWTPDGGGSRTHYHSDKEVLIVDGSHDPIIPLDVWEQAQQKVNEIKSTYPKYARQSAVKHDYMFRGLVRCSNCGATLTYNARYDGLQCYKYTKGKCDKSHFINQKKLADSLIKGLQQALDSTKLNIEYRTLEKITVSENFDLQIKKENEKLKRVKEAYAAGIDTLSEYKQNKNAIMDKIKQLESKKTTTAKPTKTESYRAIHNEIQNFIELFNSDVSPDMLNQSLKRFISKIVFNREQNSIKIFYYL